jgi:hypothetical protein
MANEFARDKQATLKGLQQCIDQTGSRRKLGSSYREEMDESGPGYAIRTNSTVDSKEETTASKP